MKNVSKLSEFMLKTRKMSPNGVRKVNLIQKENKIIFLTPLADIFSCFKQENIWYIFHQ